MRAVLTALCIGLSAFILTGCGEKNSVKTPMELKDVPPEIMKVAKEKLPGVKFEQAWKAPNGNYEVRGKSQNGKVRDIQVKPDGTVVEVD